MKKKRPHHNGTEKYEGKLKIGRYIVYIYQRKATVFLLKKDVGWRKHNAVLGKDKRGMKAEGQVSI